MVFDADGKPVKLFGICANTTERRNAQTATALLASIVASSDDAVISKTLGGMITRVGIGARNGYSATHLWKLSVSTLR